MSSRHPRRALAALAMGAAAVLAYLVAVPSADAAGTTPRQIPERSRLPWASGAFTSQNNIAAQTAFGSFRGTPTDVAVTWPARQSWSDLSADWIISWYKSAPQTVVLGLPPFPENTGGSNAACASGAYDAQWKQIAQKYKDAGMADNTIIRLGWEWNGDWYEWAAKNPADFAACWRQVFTAAESVAPALRWDWNPNRGKSQLGIDPTKAWPGDEYVDIVGVDSYDGWPGATNEATWDEHLNGAYGLNYWRDFAQKHGKKLSVPEWGVFPGTAWVGHNGGDNPFYIKKMFGFFKANADLMAYESYFNETASYYAGALEMNPQAAAAYKQQIAAALGLGGRVGDGLAGSAGGAAEPAATPSATAKPTPAPTRSSSAVSRQAVREVELPETPPAVIAPYDDAGVSLSTPTVRTGSDGVKVRSAVGVRTPQSLSGLRLVVTDADGRAVRIGDTEWCLTIEDTYDLDDFGKLPAGHYQVRADYTVDGRRWTSGPGAQFDVW